jgi:MSHA biogenesis protein MshE
MRDPEATEVAIRAALTGHLVFSTLHTNDAESAVVRLRDMGIDGYLLAATMRAVLAQRLLKHNCPECRVEKTLREPERAWLARLAPHATLDVVYEGSGCRACNQLGTSGRIGVYACLMIDDAMRDALRLDDIQAYMRLAQSAMSGHTLFDEAIAQVAAGEVPFSELARVSSGM